MLLSCVKVAEGKSVVTSAGWPEITGIPAESDGETVGAQAHNISTDKSIAIRRITTPQVSKVLKLPQHPLAPHQRKGITLLMDRRRRLVSWNDKYGDPEKLSDDSVKSNPLA